MKRAIVFIPLLLALVILLTAPRPTGAGAPPSVDVEKMAREGFESDIKDIKSGKHPLELTGFDSLADVEKAELGEGFRIFALNPIKIMADDSPYDPKSHVTPWYLWAYLIRVEGKAKTLLHIFSRMDEREKLSEVVLIGSSPISNNETTTAWLAKELDGLLAAWPASAGYQHRIIMNIYVILPDGLSSVVELSRNGKVLGFFPLTYIHNEIARSFTASDLLDPTRFLSGYRSEARRIREMIEKQLNKK